jgi:hypothetical protein
MIDGGYRYPSRYPLSGIDIAGVTGMTMIKTDKISV